VSGRFKWVPLDKLVSPKHDVRTFRSEIFIEKLVIDIRNGKLIEPLIVRSLNGNYEVLSGETRHLALKRLKFEKAPVVIYNVDDVEALLIQCKTAMMRRSYDPIGLASLIKRLNKTKKMKLIDIARELGYKSRSFVTKLNALNRLTDDQKRRVSNGDLSIEMAYSIATNRPYSPFLETDKVGKKKQCDICGKSLPEEETFKINICPLCYEVLKSKSDKRRKEPQQTELS